MPRANELMSYTQLRPTGENLFPLLHYYQCVSSDIASFNRKIIVKTRNNIDFICHSIARTTSVLVENRKLSSRARAYCNVRSTSENLREMITQGLANLCFSFIQNCGCGSRKKEGQVQRTSAYGGVLTGVIYGLNKIKTFR